MKIEILIRDTYETNGEKMQETLPYEKVQISIEGTKEECLETLEKISHHLYVKN